MKIEKSVLAPKIEKLKNAVSKSDRIPAWQGILVRDGELTAGSQEITVKAKTGCAGGESFIIPAEAFDLIKSLPDGEMSITADSRGIVAIRTGRIKNSFRSLDAEEFPLPPALDHAPGSAEIPADVVKRAVRHVLYAVSKDRLRPAMYSLLLEADGGKLNFVGTDGRMLAWHRIDFEGSFKMLIPRSAAEKLLSLEMDGDVAVEFDKNHAVFRSAEYEIYTRLTEGRYFAYERMFAPLPVQAGVSRKELLDAVLRAKLCAEGEPVRFDIDEELKISTKGSAAEYCETVVLQKKVTKPVVIGFNPKLVIETLKAFDCENIRLSFANQKNPMIAESEDGSFKAVVLPVAI